MEGLPTITIDWSFFNNFFNTLLAQPTPFHAVFFLLQAGGWVPLVIMLWAGGKIVYLMQIQMKWAKQQKTVLLAVDVPRGNEQSPKAVENVFAHFYGMKSGTNFKDKWLVGKFQLSLSAEIVSHGGDIQFYIRTPLRSRDLVEAAIFSQYPDAEITEAEDYAQNFPKNFPSDTHNVFGCDFNLSKDSMFPIRTYPAFEHSLTGEFKDPMSLVMEAMGRIAKEEYLAFQILITPTGDDWRKTAFEKLQGMLGKKVTKKKTMVEQGTEMLTGFVSDALLQLTGGSGSGEAKKEDAMKMMNLSPGERRVIENIEYKLAKTGFLCKLRFVQVGPRETFRNKFGEVKGFLRQFAALDSNSFGVVGDTIPGDDYFWDRWFKPGKQRKIVRAFAGRDGRYGGPKYILNIEELATLWHFPAKEVKAPKITKTEAKTAEPPRGLPTR
jgi:hypothetical protein